MLPEASRPKARQISLAGQIGLAFPWHKERYFVKIDVITVVKK
jgi:hypothetical protein